MFLALNVRTFQNVAEKYWQCLEVCEAGFSEMTNIKSSKRNTLTDIHIENLRAEVTENQSQIQKISSTIQREISHWNGAWTVIAIRLGTELLTNLH